LLAFRDIRSTQDLGTGPAFGETRIASCAVIPDIDILHVHLSLPVAFRIAPAFFIVKHNRHRLRIIAPSAFGKPRQKTSHYRRIKAAQYEANAPLPPSHTHIDDDTHLLVVPGETTI
jgi:hypothetical protein